MRKTLVVAVGAALCLCVGYACAQEPSRAEPAKGSPTYALSGNGREEILVVGYYGGSQPESRRYFLYGDGRLVREIFAQGTDAVLHTDEVEIPQADIDTIFRPLVAARVPELTEDRARQATGGVRGEDMGADLATVRVKMSFSSYQSSPSKAREPLQVDTSLHGPGLLARNFPDFAEAKAIADLGRELDRHFPKSVYEAKRSTGAQQ
jgi:hypothetical protein